MSQYEVDCEWDGYYWVATVSQLPGGVTQAKRLDLVPDRIREVIKLLTGESPQPDEIVLRPHVDEGLDQVSAEIVDLESRLHVVDEELARRRRLVVNELRRRGFPLRDIGVIAHLSHQRVHQLLSEVVASVRK